MKFAEYLLLRNEDLAFSILERDLRNEGLLRGLRGILNIAKGGKYNKNDVKTALNTSNIIANTPEIAGAGKGLLDIIRNLGLSAGLLTGGDIDHQPPQPTPIVRAYTPPAKYNNNPYDIYKNLKSSRALSQEAEREAEREAYIKSTAFSNIGKQNKRDDNY